MATEQPYRREASSRRIALDDMARSACEEHDRCVVFVQHYAVEVGAYDSREPGGVVRVVVHRRRLHG